LWTKEEIFYTFAPLNWTERDSLYVSLLFAKFSGLNICYSLQIRPKKYFLWFRKKRKLLNSLQEKIYFVSISEESLFQFLKFSFIRGQKEHWWCHRYQFFRLEIYLRILWSSVASNLSISQHTFSIQTLRCKLCLFCDYFFALSNVLNTIITILGLTKTVFSMMILLFLFTYRFLWTNLYFLLILWTIFISNFVVINNLEFITLF